MRKIDWLHYASSRQLVDHLHEIDLITQPFSDGVIFDLQEKFLSNGFQYLKAKDVERGRSIIYAFLESLALYHEISCLTLAPIPPLKNAITDLYYELNVGGYLTSFEPYYLDEFFFEFYYDFMWIEATRPLLMSPWFEDVKKKIIDMGIDQNIPIIVVVYEE